MKTTGRKIAALGIMTQAADTTNHKRHYILVEIIRTAQSVPFDVILTLALGIWFFIGVQVGLSMGGASW